MKARPVVEGGRGGDGEGRPSGCTDARRWWALDRLGLPRLARLRRRPERHRGAHPVPVVPERRVRGRTGGQDGVVRAHVLAWRHAIALCVVAAATTEASGDDRRHSPPSIDGGQALAPCRAMQDAPVSPSIPRSTLASECLGCYRHRIRLCSPASTRRRTRDLWVSWVERQRVIGERVSGSTESLGGFRMEGRPGVVFGLFHLPFGPLLFPAGHEASTDGLSLR